MTDQSDSIGISIDTDELGRRVMLRVDTSVYSKVAVFKTAYWYTDSYYLFLDRSSPDVDEVRVEIRHKDEANQESLDSIGAEFFNRLIDQQVRQDTLKETGEVREQLIKKAFFDASSHLNPDHLISDESRLPTSEQDYHDDPLAIGRERGV